MSLSRVLRAALCCTHLFAILGAGDESCEPGKYWYIAPLCCDVGDGFLCCLPLFPLRLPAEFMPLFTGEYTGIRAG